MTPQQTLLITLKVTAHHQIIRRETLSDGSPLDLEWSCCGGKCHWEVKNFKESKFQMAESPEDAVRIFFEQLERDKTKA